MVDHLIDKHNLRFIAGIAEVGLQIGPSSMNQRTIMR
jgi:hypothetical protein